MKAAKKKGGGGKNIGKEHWHSVNTSMHGIWKFEKKEKNEDFKLNLIWFSITKTFNEIKLMFIEFVYIQMLGPCKVFSMLIPGA